MLKNKKILVTGGAGFIGSHLVERLESGGALVTVADIAGSPRIDITNFEELESLGNFNYIFHLAALASPSGCEKLPQETFGINVYGTYNILKFAYKNVEKIIFPTSASLYERSKLPLINEQEPIDLTSSIYCASKRVGELMIEDFYNTYGLPYIYFRIFNCYGPRQNSYMVVSSFIEEAMKTGKIEVRSPVVRRDFIYVDDVVDALIKGAESDYIGGPINLGTGVETSIGELAEKIAASFTKRKIPVSYINKETFGPKRLICDNSLAKKVLDWSPKVTLTEGLWKTIESCRYNDND